MVFQPALFHLVLAAGSSGSHHTKMHHHVEPCTSHMSIKNAAVTDETTSSSTSARYSNEPADDFVEEKYRALSGGRNLDSLDEDNEPKT